MPALILIAFAVSLTGSSLTTAAVLNAEAADPLPSSPPAISRPIVLELPAALPEAPAVAQEAPREERKPPVATSTIPALIARYASKYGVSRDLMTKLVSCETSGTFDPAIQSRHIRADGTREKSFGLAQIHLPDHEDVTLEQAKDPDFALDFMATHLAAGRLWMWKNCIELIL